MLLPNFSQRLRSRKLLLHEGGLYSSNFMQIYCYATYIADRDVHKYHESNLFRREQRKYKYFKIIC